MTREGLAAEVHFFIDGKLFWATCSRALFRGESFEVAEKAILDELMGGNCLSILSQKQLRENFL